MSKKIDNALKDLLKALKKHGALASDKKAKRGAIQRAAAKVRSATMAYDSLVTARTGTSSPFSDISDPQLDDSTVASLTAERDSLSKRLAAAEEKTAAQETAARESAARESAAQESAPPSTELSQNVAADATSRAAAGSASSAPDAPAI